MNNIDEVFKKLNKVMSFIESTRPNELTPVYNLAIAVKELANIVKELTVHTDWNQSKALT